MLREKEWGKKPTPCSRSLRRAICKFPPGVKNLLERGFATGILQLDSWPISRPSPLLWSPPSPFRKSIFSGGLRSFGGGRQVRTCCANGDPLELATSARGSNGSAKLSQIPTDQGFSFQVPAREPGANLLIFPHSELVQACVCVCFLQCSAHGERIAPPLS